MYEIFETDHAAVEAGNQEAACQSVILASKMLLAALAIAKHYRADLGPTHIPDLENILADLTSDVAAEVAVLSDRLNRWDEDRNGSRAAGGGR